VPKAERVLLRERRIGGADELLADQTLQGAADRNLGRHQIDDCGAPELLTDDGGRLDDGALVCTQLVDSRSQ
jgi:hypothetical protein